MVFRQLFHSAPIERVGRRGRERMVVGFTTTCAINAFHQQSCESESRLGEVYFIPHYMIKFVSDFRQLTHGLRSGLNKVRQRGEWGDIPPCGGLGAKSKGGSGAKLPEADALL